MVTVTDLRKVYEDKKKRTRIVAVDGVSFDARAGEVLALLGPNGAGKTTTLRILATILEPSGGTAFVNGHDIIKEPRAVRSSLGFLSGDMGLYNRLTPRELVRFYGKLAGMKDQAIDSRTRQLFRRLEVESFADRRMETFSTGMRQRVAIARAVIHDPPVLVLDEPTLGLDVPSAHSVEQFILEAKAVGKCVLYSTHVMEEAEYICDRIAVIHQGKIQTIGTMEELRQRTGKQRLREIFLGVLGLLDGRAAARAATETPS